MTTRIGVIGYGYWGPNLVRNFVELPDAEVVAVCDRDEGRLEVLSRRYPTIDRVTDAQAIFGNPDIDAVAIATPVSTHHPLAMAALQAGKHVMVEKPLAATAADARELVAEAEKRNLVLMVDHTFVYTGAVRKMRELLVSGEIGNPLYYDSVRVNLGLFQHDVSVLWDLAVHDLSVIEYLFDRRPTAVSATGIAHVEHAPENVAYLTLYFEDRFFAHIHVNWLSPVKVRRTLIGGDKKMIVWDDIEPSEKVKVVDKGIDVQTREQVYDLLISYRSGDIHSPKLDGTEALRREMSHFVACVRGEETPETPGVAGQRVVEILEAAQESMKQRGAPIELPR